MTAGGVTPWNRAAAAMPVAMTRPTGDSFEVDVDWHGQHRVLAAIDDDRCAGDVGARRVSEPDDRTPDVLWLARPCASG